jgi:hypothetical protein
MHQASSYYGGCTRTELKPDNTTLSLSSLHLVPFKFTHFKANLWTFNLGIAQYVFLPIVNAPLAPPIKEQEGLPPNQEQWSVDPNYGKGRSDRPITGSWIVQADLVGPIEIPLI